MKKFFGIIMVLLICVCYFTGCQTSINDIKTENAKEDLSLMNLRQETKKANCLCAVAYLGNGIDIQSFLDSKDSKKYREKYNFINEISSENYFEFSGEEIYLIVPAEEDTKMRILEIPTDGTSTILSEKNLDTGNPILIKGNQSEIIPNALIELTMKSEEKLSISPSLSLKDGKLWTGNETGVYDFTIYEEIIPSAYKNILEKYYNAISENKNTDWYVQNNLNYLVSNDFIGNAMENVGYVIIDLDDDGVDELVIGTTDNVKDKFYQKMILAIHSGDKEVFSSTERNRLYFTGDNIFANIGSNSVSDSINTALKYENGEMIDMNYIVNPEDYRQIEFTPFSNL